MTGILNLPGLHELDLKELEFEYCYLAPLWIHFDRGLMEPLESRANGTTRIAA
jgi:hypothetical protein